MPSQDPISPTRREFFRTTGIIAPAAALWPALPSTATEGAFPDLAEMQAEHARRGAIPPDQTYRTMEWEFHTPPQANFAIDVEAAMKASRDAGAECVLLYTQDSWGYAFYPTRVGVVNPSLSFDLFGREVEAARRLGLSVIAYYSVQYNNQIVLSHPDWGWVNEKGEQQRRRGRWYLACMDTPYRQIVLGMIEEIFSRYEADELFLDCFAIQQYFYHREDRDPFCYCRHTEEAWEKEFPGDPYRQGFKTREGWERRYRWLQKRSMSDFLDEIIVAARKHRPKLIVAINGGPEVFPNDVMEKVQFIYAEPLPCATGISLGSILMRGWGRPHYQAGVFTQQGYLDTYPGSVPRVQADSLIVQNARTFFIGNAPIIGGLDGKGYSRRWFKVAKEHWTDVRNVDCLLDGIEPVLSTAMLYSEATRQELDARRLPGDFRESTLGALETLTYAGRPVESVPEFRLTPEFLRQFETLVLPEVEVLSDAHADIIRQWVKQGGTLVASYKCGLLDEKLRTRANFPLADVFGVDYAGEETKYALDGSGQLKKGFIATYLESSPHRLAGLLAESTVGLPGTFLRLNRTSAEEVMHYRLPFMVEDIPNNQWYNWGAPPPGDQTGTTAVAYHRYGQGHAVYIGVPIFRGLSARSGWGIEDRPFWIREWIPDLLQQLVPNPIAEIVPVPFTEYVHGTLFYDKRRRFVLVQVLNTVELATKGKYRGSVNALIRINPRKLPVVGARAMWPKSQDLRVASKGSRLHIELPDIERYAAVYLKLA